MTPGPVEVPEPTPEIVAEILALTTPGGRGGRLTIRRYLVELLAALWTGDASGKYGMTGESDWRYDLYGPLLRAFLIPAWRDGYGVGYRLDGTEHPEDLRRANDLIVAAIKHLGGAVVNHGARHEFVDIHGWRPSYPSEATEPITEPFGGGSPFSGFRLGDVQYTDGRAYLIAALHAAGWLEVPDGQSNSAGAWVDALLRRYPGMAIDDYSRVPEIWAALAVTVDDPNDWDSVGAVLNMLQLIETLQ